jgi:ABC-type transport system involved in multi-copper enzyme maturation permease subunit
MGAFRAEWRKLVHARSVLVLLGAVVAGTAALCWQGALNAASGVSDLRLATAKGAGTLALAVYSVLLAPIMGALVGARIGARDFMDGSVGTAIVTMGRNAYVLGKLLSVVAAAALVSVAVGATGAVFGAVAQRGWPRPGDLAALVVPAVFATICTLLGALLALVLASGVRSVKATVAILVGLFIGPSALPTDVGTQLARLQPFYLVTQFLPNAFSELGTNSMLRLHPVNELGTGPAALLALLLVAVYVVAATAIWQRREVNA